MGVVRIGLDGARLEVRDADVGTRTEYLTMHVAVDGELTATKRVFWHYTDGFDGLTQFFAQLAAGWRGWAGPRVWESLEGDVTIEAHHNGRHVLLAVTLRQGLGAWSASAEVRVEPGEELSRVAADLAELSGRE